MSRYSAIGQSRLYTNQLGKSVILSLRNDKTNMNISGWIRDFLHGYINNLPSINYVTNIINSLKENEYIISDGYGVRVTLYEPVNDEYCEVVILLEEPIENSIRCRYDIISSTVHKTKVGNKKFSDLKSIKKPKGFPEYDEKRVAKLQKYLGDIGHFESKKAINQVTDLSKPIENEKAKVNTLKMTIKK